MKPQEALRTGALLSALTLAFLGWLATLEASFLKLEPQWIAVSGVPLLISLLVSGSISKLKAFGLEFETLLKEPIEDMTAVASEALSDIPQDEKRSYEYLENLPLERKREIRWLKFVIGRENYYSDYVVGQYLVHLPNLDYFEIEDAQGNIVCFLPAASFRVPHRHPQESVNRSALLAFITALENGTVQSEFRQTARNPVVSSKDSLVQVLRKLKEQQAGFASVMTPEGKRLGFILKTDVEQRIADVVLKQGPNDA